MEQTVETNKPLHLHQRWTELETKKNPILHQAEEYARWTLPHIFPHLNTNSVELQLAKDSIGAQAVNHLSNKVVSTLFPPQTLFFRLHISEEMKITVRTMIAQSGAAQEQASQAVATAMAQVEEELASTEKRVQDYMDMVAYRPQATDAAKLLIVTGNAMLFYPKNAPFQVYNLRDYCVERDLSGRVVEIMTKEKKAFVTFSEKVQEQLRGINKHKYTDQSDVTIWTRAVLENDGKFHIYQCGDHAMLDTTGATYDPALMPWVPLTWNLIRGEDYGRGLVGDFAGAFHAVNVLTGSLLNMAAVMSDIKFLVNPASLVEVDALNKSPSGSFHPGREGDVTTVTAEFSNNAAFIQSMLERYERQIAQAFLLNSQLTRDAERVTAEEIRAQANELETSNGGIYSRLAAQWQVPTAAILLDHIDFQGLQMGVVPKVVTGMDSLSRVGELDNLRMFIADLSMLNNLPEDMRARMNLDQFAKICGTNRQVDIEKIVKSEAQLQAEMQAAQQAQQQMVQNQANADSQVAAAKQMPSE